MPWCPKCRDSHAGEATLCPDCGFELLPKMPSSEDLLTDVEWVIVAENLGPVTTALVKSRLEDGGIPAIIQGGIVDTVQQYPGSDEKIFVPARFLAEAEAIVRAMQEEQVDEPVCGACGARIDFEDTVCPNCGEEFVPEEELESEKDAEE